MTSARHLATAACLRSTPPPHRHPQQWCCRGSTGLLQIRPAAILLGQDWTASAALGAAGCGIVNLLATETQKQRSSASYASLLGCMRCAPVCEVDCERSTEHSTGVSVRLSNSLGTTTVACGGFFEWWTLAASV